MTAKRGKMINRILIIAIVILSVSLIAIIFNGISEYNEGLNGYSYSEIKVTDLEDDLYYGEYDWMLRELKSYRPMLFSSDAEDYDEIRAIVEYYQWSTIANAYDYIGDVAFKAEYAARAEAAKTKVISDGKYSQYLSDIEKLVSR